ncbi:hypothetical protein ACM66B_006712 [Microbotryomycetes sp. NB124-2]
MQSSFDSMTLEHTLDDLSARFIVNLPAEELESMDRICFQIEQAHWYYEDFVRPTAANPSLLPSFGLKAFSLLMFKSCPLLHDLVPNHAQIWTSFMAYKERVPVCGAVLVSDKWNKALLVKGWQKGSTWSFPRGKINKNEPQAACAVREVYEETGYDASWAFSPEQLQQGYVERAGERDPFYVEVVIREQKLRLYFIPNVPEDTVFETRTRKEISRIEWFKLSDLPTWSKRKKKQSANGQKQPKYYMVTPFISHLRSWVEQNKPKNSCAPIDERAKAEKVTSADMSALLPAGTTVTAQPSFATAEEGTAALNAFFFDGGSPERSPTQQETRQEQHSAPALQSVFDLASLDAQLAATAPKLISQPPRPSASDLQPAAQNSERNAVDATVSIAQRPTESLFSPKQEASALLSILNSRQPASPHRASPARPTQYQAEFPQATAHSPHVNIAAPPVVTMQELELEAKRRALLRALSAVVEDPQPPAQPPVIPTTSKSVDAESTKKQALLSILNTSPLPATQSTNGTQHDQARQPVEAPQHAEIAHSQQVLQSVPDPRARSHLQPMPAQISDNRLSPIDAPSQPLNARAVSSQQHLSGINLLHHVMSSSPSPNASNMAPQTAKPNSAALLSLLNAPIR